MAMPQHATQSAPWLRYLGLPYRWGGDPDRHGGTDCLRLTVAVLGLYDAPRPAAIKPEWYAAAGRGRWHPLLRELATISEPVPGATPLDVALLAGGAPIALGVCVAGGVITTCQGHGVHWRPLAACQIRRWFRFLPPVPSTSRPNLIL
jgi:hypothetical protein